jgi:hypothetical protein
MKSEFHKKAFITYNFISLFEAVRTLVWDTAEFRMKLCLKTVQKSALKKKILYTLYYSILNF